MRMDSATAPDVKAFLVGFDVVATRHRMATVLKGFYRFLMEHFDEIREVLVSRGMEVKADAAFFEKVYRGFKARPPGTTPPTGDTSRPNRESREDNRPRRLAL